MAIKINWQDLQKRIINWQEVQKVMLNWSQIRPSSWPTPTGNELYFEPTEGTMNSVIWIYKIWNPTEVNLEYRYYRYGEFGAWNDFSIWRWYDIFSWEKLYIRNKSETPTWFSTSFDDYYHIISQAGTYKARGDIGYLLCKNSTNTIPSMWFYNFFKNEMLLIEPPSLPATNLSYSCYAYMFKGCYNLSSLPSLPATQLQTLCYNYMFVDCINIKLSETQTWIYQTPYRIPSQWTGVDGTNSLYGMFYNTRWTFAWTPNINHTYYTSNQVI